MQARRITESNYFPVIVLLTLALVWGSSFILIKKSLQGFPPLLFVAIRISMTGLLFLPFVIRHRKRIDWSLWPYLLVVGYIGSFIPFILYAFAQTQISSSVAGMINSLTPIFTLIIGVILFKNPIITTQVLGTLIGLGGAFLLIFKESQSIDAVPIIYGLLMVIATICYGISVNTVKSKLATLKSLDISSTTFVLASIPCLVYVCLPFNTDYLMTMPNPGESFFYVTLLVVIGTYLATMIFFRLVQMTSAVFATMVAYLMPIVAIGWGLLDGERFSAIHAIGIVLILLGVYYVRKKKPVL